MFIAVSIRAFHGNDFFSIYWRTLFSVLLFLWLNIQQQRSFVPELYEKVKGMRIFDVFSWKIRFSSFLIKENMIRWDCSFNMDDNCKYRVSLSLVRIFQSFFSEIEANIFFFTISSYSFWIKWYSFLKFSYWAMPFQKFWPLNCFEKQVAS